MRQEAIEQYNRALKSGQKYVKEAAGRGGYPYPPVLDELTDRFAMSGVVDLGVVDVPADLIAGTVSAGRKNALAGNFMPVLPADSEFGAKWIALCDAQLGDEGIREPVQCLEYLGRFYVQEGNKRVSVLKSFGAPVIPARVSRLIPPWSEDEEIRIYYEFMHFYALTRLYGVTVSRCGSYGKLLAALGMEEDRIWTEDERRRFSAGFSRFKEACQGLALPDGIAPAEVLTVWLGLYRFGEIRDMTAAELKKSVTGLLPDVKAFYDAESGEILTEQEEKSSGAGLLTRLFGSSSISAAFIYAFDPESSAWTRSHEHGRVFLEEKLGERIRTKVYQAEGGDYYAAMERAAADKADVIFATTPAMISSCRRIAAEYPNIHVFNCALSQPYTGVRTYYCRIHESKFITGAIAGAMADNNRIGYIADYPILGVPAAINAFALGARLTNPRARITLKWSCLPGDPLQELLDEGIRVISNRNATNPVNDHRNRAWGTFLLSPDGLFTPLSVPCWNWGPFYETAVLSILSGTLSGAGESRPVNYWYGLKSGVADIQFSDTLPQGVLTLAEWLKSGIADGSVDPFLTPVRDRQGQLRLDGKTAPAPEELMRIDWLCENVEGALPAFEDLLPFSRETVRLLGVYRGWLPPEKEEKQL